MRESEKTYIECRIFILGEKNVGKKSFVCRLLNLPSTSEIRNLEAEEEFNKKIIKLTKKIEQEEEFMRESEEQKKKKIPKNKSESLSFGNTTSLKRTKKDDETKTISNMNETNKNFVPNFNLGTQSGFKLRNFPAKIENSKIYHRPPIPEYPSKLFNVYKTKMIFKPYFISPAENLPYDSLPKDDEDSDYEFEKEHKMTMKGIKSEIGKIMNIKKTVIEYEKINGYKIYVYYIFLLLYDMSDYLTFESIIKYYGRLEKKYNISEEENLFACVIGNKKDKKAFFTEEQIKNVNDFISKANLKLYEISTKPFFNFAKFFKEFIIDNIGPLHPDIFKENNFENELKNVIENKSNFPKAIRTSFDPYADNPGPDYDLNIYGFNSIRELREALINKKTRFTRKIFANKQGPILCKSKSSRDMLPLESKDKNLLYISQGGILNKPIKGYSFGLIKGKLNLIKSRKDLYLERNRNLMESIEGDCTLNVKNSTIKSRGEDYFEEAAERKNKIQKKLISDRHIKLDRIARIHQNNLDRIAAEKEAQKNNINPNMRNMNRSSSAPDLFDINYNLNSEKNDEINFNKQRYYDIVYSKNKDYLDKFHMRRIKIEKDRINEEKRRNKEIDRERERLKELEIEKEKEKIRERERIQKYRRMEAESGKGRTVLSSYSLGDGPGYPDFKDEFEKIVEKNKRRINITREFKPRFQDITKEKIQKPYNDEKIWKKWESNRENLKVKGHLKIFLDYCRQKEIEHGENMRKIEEQNDEIRKIRREILIKKGYSDPAEIKSINYSLVEESSPKYSMKGRSMPKTKVDNEEVGNLLLGQNLEMIEYIRNAQINRPLPNINYVKPNYPSIIFNKAERFINSNKPYEGSMDLFKDGIFAPKTQEDFRSKGTFPQNEKRGLIFQNSNSPSPCDYKIKSSFDIIAEEGKKISEIRKKIKINEEIEKENRAKMMEEEKMKKEEKNRVIIENEKENNTNNNTGDKDVFKFTNESEEPKN